MCFLVKPFFFFAFSQEKMDAGGHRKALIKKEMPPAVCLQRLRAREKSLTQHVRLSVNDLSMDEPEPVRTRKQRRNISRRQLETMRARNSVELNAYTALVS